MRCWWRRNLTKAGHRLPTSIALRPSRISCRRCEQHEARSDHFGFFAAAVRRPAGARGCGGALAADAVHLRVGHHRRGTRHRRAAPRRHRLCAEGQFVAPRRSAVERSDARGRAEGGAQRNREQQRRDQEVRLKRLSRTYRMLSSTGSAILRLRNRTDLFDEVRRIAVNQSGRLRRGWSSI